MKKHEDLLKNVGGHLKWWVGRCHFFFFIGDPDRVAQCCFFSALMAETQRSPGMFKTVFFGILPYGQR
jgi:hypothetical protein